MANGMERVKIAMQDNKVKRCERINTLRISLYLATFVITGTAI